MAPQEQGHKDTMMSQQQEQQHEQLEDAEQDTADEKSLSECCSAQDLFRYIDSQHSTLNSQIEDCELKRKEVVREMAQHMLSFENASDDDDSDAVFQRHTELTMQLSGLQRELNKLKKNLESVQMLSDKRNDVEATMRRRYEVIESGGSSSFSIEELRQIIESQASATLEVEILNEERNILEVQLKESQKQTERLQMQCSEKDERIKVLKQQNESYQNELGHQQSESTVSSQVSTNEMTQISNLRSNLQYQNEYIRRRLRTSTFAQRSHTPPKTVQISRTSERSTPLQKNPTAAKLSSDDHKNREQLNQLARDIQGNLRGDKNVSEEDIKRKEEEKKLRKQQQHLRDEAMKEKERSLREQRLKREASEEEERLRIEQQKERQKQQRERWVQDETAKEEERRIREMQEQQQAAMHAHDAVTNEKGSARAARSLLPPIPETEINRRASLEVTNYQRQSRRQAARMMNRSALSPTPSTSSTLSRASVQTSQSSEKSAESAFRSMAKSANGVTPGVMRMAANGQLQSDSDDSFTSFDEDEEIEDIASEKAESLQSESHSKASEKDRSMHSLARSAHGGMPGAMRMASNGQSQSESDDSDDNSFEDDGSDFAITAPEPSGSFTVTATLVRESSFVMSERERLFQERERELEQREAEIAKQARSMQSLTAPVEVIPAATAVATVSRTGSLRSLSSSSGGRAQQSLSKSSLWQSSRTMGEDGVLPELDEGPMRFHPLNERSLRNQFLDISDKDYECYQKLQTRWEKKRKDKGGAPYSETMILRFLRNTCRKDGSFNLSKAWKAMKKTKERNLFLSANKLEKQLLTATLFPVPGLLSNAGFEMFYMKPCRFHRKDSVKDVINNLVYVINCMAEKEGNAKNGIGFIACMNDWKMSNFEVNYCYQFMMVLQAVVVPVAVELFLIVNPPSWFGGIWKIMKPMLAPSFRKKVKVIKEPMLDNYLMEGYQQYLPDDLATGTVDTFQLAQDFVTYLPPEVTSRDRTVSEAFKIPALGLHLLIVTGNLVPCMSHPLTKLKTTTTMLPFIAVSTVIRWT
ncbi:unnamed protein product [Cylindrotheca closterium]|uniref:CRAL-TRIO domain-containing protein n=1 Tax=Cylindrotheca closterium TaxID=2856 RepID=A0AAD2FJR9_9STRA|nr:unnamed protein product [Cylindrotheca closterium]